MTPPNMSATREEGFTLIETIIAFAVVSLSLIVAVKSISTSLHGSERARIQDEIRYIARNALAEATYKKPDNGTVDEFDGRYKREISVKAVSVPNATDLRMVTVTVSHLARPKMSSTFFTVEESR